MKKALARAAIAAITSSLFWLLYRLMLFKGYGLVDTIMLIVASSAVVLVLFWAVGVLTEDDK